MKICVIVVAAHHTESLKILKNNLDWALNELNFEIHAFTFKQWKLKSYGNLIIHETNSPLIEWHEFYPNDIEFFIKENLDKFKAFILIEQDIWYRYPIKHLVQESVYKSCIIMDYAANYFSVFDKLHNLIYPRIWEGGMIIPTDIIRHALDSGVKLGYTMNYCVNNLDSLDDGIFFFERRKHLNEDSLYISVKEKLRSQRNLQMDTCVDLTLFCLINKIPFKIVSNSNIEFARCDIIENRLCYHFGCAERLHRYAIGKNIPELYDKPTLDLFEKYFSHFDYMWSNTIFSLYICNIIDWNYDINKIFYHPKSQIKQINKITNEINFWAKDYLPKIKKVIKKTEKIEYKFL